jgi:hypothetical protein
VTRRRPDSTVLATIAVAILSVLTARLIEHLALRDVPHVMDEMAYILEARTFLLGHVTVPPQLPRAAFEMWLVDNRAARYAVFPPGWPVLLAMAMRVHLELWLNPLLHGATVMAVGSVVKRLGGEWRSRLAGAAIYGFSPQALLLAASLMSQPLIALCAVVVVLGGVSACSGSVSRGPMLAAGVALGVAVAARPACALVLGLTLAVFLAIALRRGRLTIASVMALAAPVALGSALLLVYNGAVTGRPTRFPQNLYFEEHGPPVDLPDFRYRPGCNDLGFGASHGCDATPHTIADGVANTGENAEAWGLLAGGGPLIFVAALLGAALGRERAASFAALSSIGFAVAIYALYWNAGTCFGARFYHAALPPLCAVAGVGIEVALARWRVIALAAATVWLAWNGYAMRASGREIANDYFGTDDRFARLAARWDRAEPAVVMIAFTHDGYPSRPTYRWTLDLKDVYFMNSVRALSALWLDSPRLDGPLVFAKYHPAIVPELRARFPNRRFFLYVVRDDAGGDELRPYDDTLAATAPALPYPKDNFDGYILPATP